MFLFSFLCISSPAFAATHQPKQFFCSRQLGEAHGTNEVFEIVNKILRKDNSFSTRTNVIEFLMSKMSQSYDSKSTMNYAQRLIELFPESTTSVKTALEQKFSNRPPFSLSAVAFENEFNACTAIFAPDKVFEILLNQLQKMRIDQNSRSFLDVVHKKVTDLGMISTYNAELAKKILAALENNKTIFDKNILDFVDQVIVFYPDMGRTIAQWLLKNLSELACGRIVLERDFNRVWQSDIILFYAQKVLDLDKTAMAQLSNILSDLLEKQVPLSDFQLRSALIREILRLDEQNENLSLEEGSNRRLLLTKSLFATLESLPVQGYSSIVPLADQIIKLNPTSTETVINFLIQKLDDAAFTKYDILSSMIRRIHKYRPGYLSSLAPILLKKLEYGRIDNCFKLSRRLIALDQNMLSDVVDRCLSFLNREKSFSGKNRYVLLLEGFSQIAEDSENEKKGITQSKEKTAAIFLHVLQNKIRSSRIKEAILYAEKIIAYDSSMHDLVVLDLLKKIETVHPNEENVCDLAQKIISLDPSCVFRVLAILEDKFAACSSAKNAIDYANKIIILDTSKGLQVANELFKKFKKISFGNRETFKYVDFVLKQAPGLVLPVMESLLDKITTSNRYLANLWMSSMTERQSSEEEESCDSYDEYEDWRDEGSRLRLEQRRKSTEEQKKMVASAFQYIDVIYQHAPEMVHSILPFLLKIIESEPIISDQKTIFEYANKMVSFKPESKEIVTDLLVKKLNFNDFFHSAYQDAYEVRDDDYDYETVDTGGFEGHDDDGVYQNNRWRNERHSGVYADSKARSRAEERANLNAKTTTMSIIEQYVGKLIDFNCNAIPLIVLTCDNELKKDPMDWRRESSGYVVKSFQVMIEAGTIPSVRRAKSNNFRAYRNMDLLLATPMVSILEKLGKRVSQDLTERVRIESKKQQALIEFILCMPVAINDPGRRSRLHGIRGFPFEVARVISSFSHGVILESATLCYDAAQLKEERKPKQDIGA